MKHFYPLCVMLLLSTMAFAQTAVQPAGGGTSNDPYQIATLDNLYWITQNSSSWGAYFKQTADIDASSSSGWDAGAGFAPIGNNTTYFTGTYDGNGHTITGLYINRSSTNSVGMFGYGSEGTIKNIGLINLNIIGSNGVGGLVGDNEGGTVTNSYSTGSVSGGFNVGGLVGFNQTYNYIAAVSSSYSTVSVSGSSHVGGLVGINYNGTVSNSYSTGSVSGGNSVGGLVGYIDNGGSISNSYSTGSVNGSGSSSTYIGGLVGLIEPGTVSNSYSTGSVSGNSDVGGLVGYIFSSSVSKSYSTGSVSGNSGVGGLVGYNYNGGSTVSNSFWDITTSNQPSSAGGTGESTTAMKTESTFTGAGWDFTNVWFMAVFHNNGYPGLIGLTPPNAYDTTYSATNVEAASATVNGSVYPDNVSTTVRFLYGTAFGVYTDSVTAPQSPVNGDTATSVSAALTGLAIGTKYYYRVSGTSSLPVNYFVSAEDTFTTAIPYAVASSATNITQTSATLNGSVNPGDINTTVRFLYGTSPGIYTDSVNASPATVNGVTATSVSAALTGLTPITHYYFRVSGTSTSPANYFVSSESSFATDVGFAIQPSGSGTQDVPYQIATLNNLYWITQNPDSWGSYFKQTADIDASSTSSWDAGAGFSPIGNITTMFTGTYDGNGHTITGLYINRVSSEPVGLFDYFAGTVKNIGLINENITGGSTVGGIAGYNYSGTLSNSYSTGSVNGSGSGSSDVGGLVGENRETISNCYTTCNVSCIFYVGGLVAYNYSGTLSNSYSTGHVSGSGSVGGLVAFNVFSTVSNSFWDTETSGQSTSDGGTGKTTQEMKTLSTFTDAGWDFTSTWARSDNYNGGYPYLQWQTFPNTITFTDGSSFTTTATPGQLNQPIGRFALQSNSSGTFDAVWITLNGTRTGASNFKLWESSDNTFNSGSDTKIGLTYSSDPGTGNNIWFTGLNIQLLTTNKYYFLTCDLASGATGAIQPVLEGNKDLMIGYGTLGTTITNAPLSNAAVPFPVELSSFNASIDNNEVTLKWRTETEVNNYGFEVQRHNSSRPVGLPSQGGDKGWVTIGSVKGAGNSNSPKSYSFVDDNPTGGSEFQYRLKQVDNDGQFKYSNVVDVKVVPSKYELFQNYPNPFNPTTTIRFDLKEASTVTLEVYNLLGQKVVYRNKGILDAGIYNETIDMSRFASGVYIYCITAKGKDGEKFTAIKKMILLR